MCWLYGGIDPDIFLSRLRNRFHTDLRGRHDQGAVMAIIIGVVAWRISGQRQRRSLGLQTTASVVESIFLVIVLDGLFAVFFASIGM